MRGIYKKNAVLKNLPNITTNIQPLLSGRLLVVKLCFKLEMGNETTLKYQTNTLSDNKQNLKFAVIALAGYMTWV